jgi:cobalt-zinc-cadmium efflux system protein
VKRESRLLVVLALNVVIVGGQVVAGLVSHSLGLLADAGHNLTDVAAVGLSYLAVRLVRRPPTPTRSFGWHRSTILSAQANAAGILAVSVLIGYEAIRRLVHPHAVHGGVVVAVAAGALVLNLLAAAIVVGGGDGDLNIRSVFLHLAGDAAASAGGLAAGAVIAATGGHECLDPAVSLAIAALIAAQAVQLVRASADILLESSPSGLDVGQLSSSMAGITGVDEVHDLHVWSLSSAVAALSAHLVLSGHPTLEEAQVVGRRVRAALAERYGIAHATLELECETCVLDGGDDCSMTAIESG